MNQNICMIGLNKNHIKSLNISEIILYINAIILLDSTLHYISI